jgi:hypothetical protein
MRVAVPGDGTVGREEIRTARHAGVALHDLMSDARKRSPQVVLTQDGLVAAAVQLGYLPGLSGPG